MHTIDINYFIIQILCYAGLKNFKNSCPDTHLESPILFYSLVLYRNQFVRKSDTICYIRPLKLKQHERKGNC